MYTQKNTNVEARQVTADNLEEIELWCMGSIKGIMLPRDERVIDIWCKDVDSDFRAQVGDYILHDKDYNLWSVMSKRLFTKLYSKVS
jgi:hypothetical protein